MTRSVVTAGVATFLPLATAGGGRRQHAAEPPCTRYRFFDTTEALFIEAACERLIPADDTGSGATAAGVAGYLDRQLAGPWGAGEQPYREGGWQPGTQIPSGEPARTPAAMFRVSLRAIDRRLGARGGPPFHRLPVAAQDTFLSSLQDGSADFPGVPIGAFFAALLGMSVEGFLSHPQHGPRRDRIGWRLGGFPGAHALET